MTASDINLDDLDFQNELNLFGYRTWPNQFNQLITTRNKGQSIHQYSISYTFYLQTSREMDQREIYRLQRENDRYRRELTQQASRYEDRITELHGVLEELKRKAEEMHTSATSAASVADATVGVDDLVEVSDSDTDSDALDVPDADAACISSDFSTNDSRHEDRSNLLVRSYIPLITLYKAQLCSSGLVVYSLSSPILFFIRNYSGLI